MDRDEHSSLLQIFVNYGRKKFYRICTWGQCYKTFPAYYNKHSSLVRKSENYGRKQFYKIGTRASSIPGSVSIKIFFGDIQFWERECTSHLHYCLGAVTLSTTQIKITTLGIMTFMIMTPSIMAEQVFLVIWVSLCWVVMLGALMLSAFMLSVLCWVSLCWMVLCWVSSFCALLCYFNKICNKKFKKWQKDGDSLRECYGRERFLKWKAQYGRPPQ
jgi:hypothetical protein